MKFIEFESYLPARWSRDTIALRQNIADKQDAEARIWNLRRLSLALDFPMSILSNDFSPSTLARRSTFVLDKVVIYSAFSTRPTKR